MQVYLLILSPTLITAIFPPPPHPLHFFLADRTKHRDEQNSPVWSKAVPVASVVRASTVIPAVVAYLDRVAFM